MNQKKVNKLTMLGMMTALVFVSNYLRITGRHDGAGETGVPCQLCV